MVVQKTRSSIIVEAETVALFEHCPFEFLEEFDVFAPTETAIHTARDVPAAPSRSGW
ncbi:Transposase, IS5 family [Halomicrobium sp. LC1Hm]|nr:Transposase, IS5 family [Halomicrobium sp. LC1Hm]